MHSIDAQDAGEAGNTEEAMRTFETVVVIGVVAACTPLSVQGLNETEFRESVVGRTLIAGPATVVVGADGTLSGSTSDGVISGTWQYKDDQFCREAKAGSRQLPYDCQVVLLEGNEVVFWRNSGKGVKAVYSITEIKSLANPLATEQDLGDEWQSLMAAEWQVVFPAPDLESLIERHQLSKNVNNSHDHEVAFWNDANSSYPKAVIHYLKTHADLAWRSRPDPRSIGDEGFFQDKAIKFDSLKIDRNRLGQVQWRLFHFDNVNCVGFVQIWGDVDPRLAGDQMIYGYYCAGPGQSLPEELARKVVAVIDIGDNKDPRRQFLSKSPGPFDGLWTGTGISESGTCRATTRKYGRLRSIIVELIIREMEITGRVTKAFHGSSPIRVNASIRGIASDSGEFDLVVGETVLGAELVMQGRLPKKGKLANGKWSTPNCSGTISFTRTFPY